MTKPSAPWPCLGCGALLSGRGGKRYCGPDCRPRCVVEGCGKPQHSKEMCGAHAARATRYGDPLAPKVRGRNDGACSTEGCERPMRKLGLCVSHYSRQRTKPRAVKPSEAGPIRAWSPPRPDCTICGRAIGDYRSRLVCSKACQAIRNRHGGPPPNPRCVRCGTEIDLLTTGKNGRRKHSNTKLCRRCKVQHRTEATPGELALRDGAFCQLCGCDVDLLAIHPDPMRPSVDHIIPRAWGGGDEAENNQLAHLHCNQVKSDRYSSAL